ncbi:MAG: globin family protein [Stellaceae bacterium]
MTPQQVALVQASFAKVAPIAEQAAALFYGRLFETAPETRTLFHGDMGVQGQKLMGAITTVVTNLSNLGAVVPVAQELAKRHVGYGVRAEHYAPVGAALLWTLGQGLGPDFTPEVSAAWAEAYGALSGVMIAAAYPES